MILWRVIINREVYESKATNDKRQNDKLICMLIQVSMKDLFCLFMNPSHPKTQKGVLHRLSLYHVSGILGLWVEKA